MKNVKEFIKKMHRFGVGGLENYTPEQVSTFMQLLKAFLNMSYVERNSLMELFSLVNDLSPEEEERVLRFLEKHFGF